MERLPAAGWSRPVPPEPIFAPSSRLVHRRVFGRAWRAVACWRVIVGLRRWLALGGSGSLASVVLALCFSVFALYLYLSLYYLSLFLFLLLSCSIPLFLLRPFVPAFPFSLPHSLFLLFKSVYSTLKKNNSIKLHSYLQVLLIVI